MSHDAEDGWVDRRVRAAMRQQMDLLRAEMAELGGSVRALATARTADRVEVERVQTDNSAFRATIADLTAEVHGYGARTQSGLEELSRVANTMAENADRTEGLRLRVEGLVVQNRWDVEQLRHAIDAIVERLPLAKS